MLKAEDLENFLNTLEQEGKVKRTNFDLIEEVKNFKLDDDNVFTNSYILDTYKFYLDSLDKLGNNQEAFLKALKHEEIKRNQALEDVDPFLIQVFMNSHHKSSTNYAIREKINNNDLTSLDLRKIHRILLNGLAVDESKKPTFREDNTSFVGTWNTKTSLDNINEISYLPLDYRLIDEAVDFILKLYNIKNVEKSEDIFLIPIFVHGLLASFQLFRDGNTRLARILAHIDLWDLSNHNGGFKTVCAPALYTSETLLAMNKRPYYRDLIKNMAINPNLETLNEWVKFNLLLIEKQLYLNQNRVEGCIKTLSRKR